VRLRLFVLFTLAFGALGRGGAEAASFLDGSSWGPTPAPQFMIVQELRLGAFYHNWIDDESSPVDLSIETLSSPLPWASFSNPYVNWFLSPHINFGAMINTGGKTSYAFGGFNWRVPIYGPVFFEGEFGGAVNDAVREPTFGRVDMGCAVTFRESGGFGAQLTPNADVILSIEHISHANLCGPINPGITDIGFRVGYKF
jgi:hypothetical protein